MNRRALAGRRRMAVAAALLWAVIPAQVVADGIGTPQYRWVHPPKFLKSTNIPPSAGHGVHALSEHGQAIFVYTVDSQVGVTFAHGAFGSPTGQRSIDIRITPLSHFPSLPGGPGSLDGNVYGIRYRYLPSQQAVTRSTKPVLLSMQAPHTPQTMLGWVGGSWRPLCTVNTLIITPSSANCYIRTLASRIVLTLKPQPKPPKPHKHSSPSHGIPVVAVIGIVLGAALILLAGVGFVRRSRGPSG